MRIEGYVCHLASRKVKNLFLPTGQPAPRLRQTNGRIANDYVTYPLARLTGTWLLNSAQQTLNYHGYEHNLRNDITRHTRTDASFVDYDYDDLGQLTDAVGSGGQSVELLAYGYDTGWNMTGDGTTGYFVNDRNQVTGMTDGTNLGYDAHGNLLGQDNWNQQYGLIYTYDAENRLTRVEEDTYYKPNALRTEFVYDGLSRLRIRKEYQYFSGNWGLIGETRYIYDGRRVIQERSSANTPTVTYTRGNDLSGSLEGAGGIGGMLARSHGYSGSTGNWSTHNYYHADAGGNITCLINAGLSITASYRYDPFSRTLFQSGTMANANVYRFSSKEVHGFTGMYYYGFRFYDPGLQRWINRDPIGEVGGINLYGFVGNSPTVKIDLFGLAFFPPEFIGPLLPGDSRCPEAPPGVSLRDNMRESAKHFNPWWFRNQVKKGGPWDYKQQGNQFEPFGNFNYGATGRANGYGFDAQFLLRLAGAAQISDGTSRPEWGDPAMSPLGLPYRHRGTPPYGDDPEDQKWIQLGIQYYEEHKKGEGPCD